MARISPDEVRRIAHLARLALADDEVERFARQLGAILEYAEQLRGLDVGEVEGTSHAVATACPQRPDEARPSDVREAALAAAPRVEEDLFAVPKVVG